MGKLFVKWGLAIQAFWCKCCCKWNWFLSKLVINVADCPVAECICKK